MRRVFIVLASGVATAMLVASCGGTAGTVSISLPVAATKPASDCPKDSLGLGARAIAKATNQALDEAPDLYGRRLAEGAKAKRAAVGPYAGVRGDEIKKACGGRTFRRSVVVDLFFPRAGTSASLSQGTVFLARSRDGFVVWRVAH